MTTTEELVAAARALNALALELPSVVYDDVRSKIDAALVSQQATIDQLTAEMATMHRSVVHQCCEDVQAERKLVDELADLVAYMLADGEADDPCSLDHHGYCQHHFGGFRDGGCWVPAARNALERRAARSAQKEST